MDEAVAAGWQRYDGEDDSIEDEEDTASRRVVWATPAHQPVAVSATNNPGNTPSSLGTTVTFLGGPQEDTPGDVKRDHNRGPPASPTSGSSDEADVDEDVSVAEESQVEDGTALVDRRQLHALLDELLLGSHPSPPESGGLFAPHIESPRRGPSHFSPSSKAKGTPESSGEPADTATPLHDGEDGAFQTPHKVVVQKASEGDSSSDGDQSDADSLDLGVPTTMWPRKEIDKFSASKNSRSENGAIVNMGKFSNMFTPQEALAINRFRNVPDATDGEESVDETDDEQHEGAHVFLLAEGARYSGHEDGSAKTNDLFNIREASYQAFEATIDRPNMTLDGNITNKFQRDVEESLGHLNFAPRFENDDDDDAMWEDLKVVGCDNQTSRDQAHGPPAEDQCFGGIQLVSPKFFTGNEKPTKPAQSLPTSIMSPLASMVHPMDLKLFDAEPRKTPAAKKPRTWSLSSESESDERASVSSGPASRVETGVLQTDQYTISESPDTEGRRSNLASSFRSSTKGNRVAYNLSSGKKSMSKTERVYSQSFLPNRPLLSPADLPVPSRRANVDHGTLTVLLVEMQSKIFEVVAVDVQRDTTVGDVLAKARSTASDPALSEQKYVSFCYGLQEFGAPMLPVKVVIDWEKHKTRPLVVAVPAGSTAAAMQSVKRVLWKNPKMRVWWKQQDPFQPTSWKDSSTPEADLPPPNQGQAMSERTEL